MKIDSTLSNKYAVHLSLTTAATHPEGHFSLDWITVMDFDDERAQSTTTSSFNTGSNDLSVLITNTKNEKIGQ